MQRPRTARTGTVAADGSSPHSPRSPPIVAPSARRLEGFDPAIELERGRESNVSHVSDLPAYVDDFEGDLARKGRTARTRSSYRWTLWRFCDRYPRLAAADITRQDCERFLNQWTACEPATLAQRAAALATFTRFLTDRGVLAVDPMLKVARPKRQRPEKLDVVTVSTGDVLRLLEAVETWPEALCLTLLSYTGARRAAPPPSDGETLTSTAVRSASGRRAAASK